MLINSGLGNSKPAGVNDENRLMTSTVTRGVAPHSNHDHQKAFSVDFGVNPDGAGDCIFYLKNQDSEELFLQGLWLQSSGGEEVYFNFGDTGTAVKTNGTDLVAANLNVASGEVADVLCYSNISDGAVDITGLSGGAKTQTIWINDAGDSKYYDFPGLMILPKNGTFSIWAVGGDTNIRGTVLYFFHKNEVS